MDKVVLRIEEYETRERFSLGQILKGMKLTTKKDKIDYYVLGILEWKEGLNISKDYIESEFSLDCFFEHLENQVKIIKNSYVLARYYEVLWFFRNIFLNIKRNEEHRIGFIENVLLSIKEKKMEDDYRIEDVLEKTLNQCKKNEKLECEIFEKLLKRGKEHKSAVSIFNTISNYKNKKKTMKEKAFVLVEEEWQEFLKEDEKSPYEFIDHFEILLKCYEKNSTEISELLEGVIKYFKENPTRDPSFINEVLTNSIIRKLIGGEKIKKQQIEEVKKLSLETGKNINFGLIETKTEVSKIESKKIIEIFLLDTEDKSIRMLLYEYLKTYEKLKKHRIKTQSQFPLSSLLSRVIYDEKRRMVGKAKTDDEKNKHEFAQWSSFYFIDLKRQLEAIFEKFNIDEKYFNKKIEKSPYFNETDKIIANKSIYYYFKSDYIIFLHLIIPRIENILRNFLGDKGGSTLGKIKKDGFKYKILGDILGDEVINKVFTEELIEYFKLVLSDDLGLNIRNDLSHGIITTEACNEHKSNIVFHILLFLIYM